VVGAQADAALVARAPRGGSVDLADLEARILERVGGIVEIDPDPAAQRELARGIPVEAAKEQIAVLFAAMPSVLVRDAPQQALVLARGAAVVEGVLAYDAARLSALSPALIKVPP
jgi:hypothetical protein